MFGFEHALQRLVDESSHFHGLTIRQHFSRVILTETINNSAWQNARFKAGLGDLHVHDLRHTVGMRLREAGVKRETISAALWHSNNSITDHYSVAMVREIYEALEKIKAEGSDWNKSLRTLIFEARAKNVHKVSTLKRKTG